MLKEFAQYLVSLRENKTYEIHGNTYSDNRLEYIEPHIDRPIRTEVSGLDSIVTLIKHESTKFALTLPLFVQLKSEREVYVFSSLDDQMERNWLYRATCDMRSFEEGYRDAERAIVELRSKYIPNEGTEYLLGLLSRINIENGVTTQDNGVSQSVEARTGISLKTMENIKPRVKLMPYRTFLEVEQPESEFLLRLSKDGDVGIFEADGGMWKLEAKKRIKDYLTKALEPMINSGEVAVMM